MVRKKKRKKEKKKIKKKNRKRKKKQTKKEKEREQGKQKGKRSKSEKGVTPTFVCTQASSLPRLPDLLVGMMMMMMMMNDPKMFSDFLGVF